MPQKKMLFLHHFKNIVKLREEKNLDWSVTNPTGPILIAALNFNLFPYRRFKDLQKLSNLFAKVYFSIFVSFLTKVN